VSTNDIPDGYDYNKNGYYDQYNVGDKSAEVRLG